MLAVTADARSKCISQESRAALESSLGGDVDDTTLYVYLDTSAANSVSSEVTPVHAAC